MVDFATPEQDKAISELRGQLAAWVVQTDAAGYDRSIALAALIMFTSEAAASTKRVTKEELLKVVSMYFDMYDQVTPPSAVTGPDKPS